MKNNTINAGAILICSLFILAGCVTTGTSNLTGDSAFTQVTDKNINDLFGKQIDLDGNFISLSEDRTFSGTWKNSPIAGTWEIRDNYWCRVLTVFHDESALNKEDCQLWELNGDRIRGTRDKGRGKSFVYTVI